MKKINEDANHAFWFKNTSKLKLLSLGNLEIFLKDKYKITAYNEKTINEGNIP